MQRNLLILQQQALARQAQQQRAAIAGMPPDQVNNSWMQQQRMQQQQLENENRMKQQRMASMYMQQRDIPQQQRMQQQQPIQPPQTTPPVSPVNATLIESNLQKKNLDLYVNRDQAYQIRLDTQHKRHMDLAQTKKHAIDIVNDERRIRTQSRGLLTFGKGYSRYGNGKTGPNNRVLYPGDKKRKRHQSARL